MSSCGHSGSSARLYFVYKKQKMKTTILFLQILFIAFGSFAQKSEVFIADEGAMHKYDPVAYFTKGESVKGNDQFTFAYKGANWYFSNEQNLNAFKANPEKYAPQYGGYCAYGMASGYKAPTDPDAWTIVNGKLYLNYNKNVQNLWNKDRLGFIKKADTNWPAVKNRK